MPNNRIEYLSGRAELIDIENDAIIECMLVEIEILEMKHQCLILQQRKRLAESRSESYSDAIYQKYGDAYMVPIINTILKEQPLKREWTALTICKSFLITLQMYICGGGGGYISPAFTFSCINHGWH